MRWLLFQKLGEGEWQPIYGPLSELAGGALVYAVVLVGPALCATQRYLAEWRRQYVPCKRNRRGSQRARR